MARHEQIPFVHEDGTTSPPTPNASAVVERGLAELIAKLSECRVQAGQGDPRVAASRREPYDRVIAILQLLQDPAVSSTVAAMGRLDPAAQAVVSGFATTLLGAGAKRHRLVLEFRSLLEKTS